MRKSMHKSEVLSPVPQALTPGVHLMAKPAGPDCNLRCDYCFYLEKEVFFPGVKRPRMTDEVLEAYVRQSAAANLGTPGGLLFSWQGGEPTLMGLDFFRRAVELEQKYCQGQAFENTLQTNGTLLTDEWCEFLAQNKFLVGLSLDGPDFVHDRHRRDAAGRGTFERVLRSLKLLQKHGVDYNVMATVGRESARHPLEIYSFFKDQGVRHVQFSPIVEREPDESARALGLNLATPPLARHKSSSAVTPWSVEPESFGDFLVAIFDTWVRHDVGSMFVMNFEWALASALGEEGAVCTMARHCGNACIVEHNGDVYACDHFVYPEYRLGNILTGDVAAMVASKRQLEWGRRKESALPRQCLECPVGRVCRGGCQKHRFVETESKEAGLNYLCPGYSKYYNHIGKYMVGFRKLAELDFPPERIMGAIDAPLLLPASEKSGNQPVLLWIR
ncbi:Radical SAM domain protein [Desulfomicrobium baculatum DSM 4028]|uniref:Radical SAM domain protein n=2 Tax=Desulfomicrobium baculatum TaxID=899 RepID=C7LQW3_DESBD|nr:Radical SAM domain protein [Desulfomicrobium baculatum DSM 4028]